ncbi:MAG: tRNA (N6-threonylcarbamoyladenosine(37)-N6)-methyltransferase TrmO [Clostridia bacterium]|nr:tRNA (N6-threonylcarbamoyladenosine(37)-N6)-methyltransferase TrmO [Clostridia bacterium]
MENNFNMKPIAYIKCDVMTKFGAPRQSGLAPSLCGRIILENEFKDKNYLKGIEGFSHLWLIWGFSEVDASHISPTVRPPVLGGNERVGVFATRSPFRPNPIGLTCVKIENIDWDSKDGPSIFVSGIDMMNDTPIYDIKPYIPYADIVPNAKGGFTDTHTFKTLNVIFDSSVESELRKTLTDLQIKALLEILSNNIKPSYQNDASRIYGINYAGLDIHFRLQNEEVVVTDFDIL